MADARNQMGIGARCSRSATFSLLTVAAAMAAVAGCRTSPKDATATAPWQAEFPIGIWSVNRVEDLSVLKEVGFNLVGTRTDAEILAAAQTLDLKVLGLLGTGYRGDWKLDRAAVKVARFDRHPALWGWYIADEPDLWRRPPSEIQEMELDLKALGTTKPTCVTLYQGYEAATYGLITDAVIVDRFPIPWLPLANFGQHIRMARLALGNRATTDCRWGKGEDGRWELEGKRSPQLTREASSAVRSGRLLPSDGRGESLPVLRRKGMLLATIQAFDWSAYPELLPDENPKSLRAPTYEEIRCMTYCALAEGADGLMFYSFDDGPGQWRIRDHTNTWAAVRSVVQEVNRRMPLFTAEQCWWPKQQHWGDSRKRFNAALTASVTCNWLHVQKGNHQVPAGDYVLTVNNTPEEQVFSFTSPVLSTNAVAVLEEDRTVSCEDGWIKDAFAPFAVHVYRVGP